MTFDDESEYKQFIATRLEGTGLPTEAVEEFAMRLDVCRQPILPTSSFPPDAMGLVVPRFRWIIKDDDLKVLDALLVFLPALTEVGLIRPTTTTEKAVSATVSTLLALVLLIRQSWKKGARVSELELRVLTMLKVNPGGLTVADIARILRRSESAAEPDVRAVLERLSKHALNDGSLATFAAEDGEGRWRAAGV